MTGNIDPHLVASAAADLMRGGVSADRWLPPALRGIRRPEGRLRALLPVHAFGQPADMDPLLDTARNADLVVIEDACEAIGAAYKGRPRDRSAMQPSLPFIRTNRSPPAREAWS